MNMMTPDLSPRARWAKSFPIPPTIPVLLAQVDRACFVARITSTRFGIQLGDGGMIHRLRKGGTCRAEKRFRILAHAEKLLEQSREEAFALLMAEFGGGGIGALVEDLIGRMDRRDGDLDLEDSETSSLMVDERGRYLADWHPAEDDEDREPDDDAKGDTAWSEWLSRGRHKLTSHGTEMAAEAMPHEDAEDDDAHEDDFIDELNGDEDDSAWYERLNQGTTASNGCHEPVTKGPWRYAGIPEDAEYNHAPLMSDIPALVA